MTLSRQAQLLQWIRWAILGAVGLLGLLLTLWVNQSLLEVEQDRQMQRFQLAAQLRAARTINQILQPVENLTTLQRLFGSVDQVDWSAFRKFAEPMLYQPGVRTYNWLPRVTSADRSVFERNGRKVWGASFAIEERDAAGRRIRADKHELYFPLLYVMPENFGSRFAGYNSYALFSSAQLIDQAVATNRVTASEIGPLSIAPEYSHAMLLIAPVYQGGIVPASRDKRQSGLSGVVIAVLDISVLFAAVNDRIREDTGFQVRLIDLKQTQEKQLLAAWNTSLPGGENPMVYSEDFALAGHAWSVQVEATPAWLEANRPQNLNYVLPLGALITLFLMLYITGLLGRSALADSLEVTHEDDLEQKRAAEAWASKLSLAVEQSPASVYITDLDGRIEYVNEKFVESTGYTRAEAIGQNTRLLRPLMQDESVYLEIWNAVRAGQNWQGELETRRRDGTNFWERLLIAPLRDSDGTITNFMAIRENISELREVMTRLQESENRFLGAMSVMVEGLAILSPQGHFIFGNRAIKEFLGCADRDLQDHTPQDLGLERLREDGSVCPPEELPSFITLHEGREVRDFVVGHRSADGTIRWFQVNTSPLRMGEEQNFGVVMTLSEITERRRAEEQLKLAFAAIRYSGEGILVTDAGQRVLSVNPAFEAMTGYRAEEIIGETPAIVASGRHDERFYAAIHEVLKRNGHWQGEVWNQRKSGEVFPEWLGVSVVRDDDGQAKYYVYIYSDMTERIETQQRIEMLAHHDPLTGLPNRLLLRDRVEQAQAKASRMHSHVALMFLDLDRFKTINDSLGHPVGDALLREVVERLKSCVRESDTISRQGGDEFIILLNDVRDSEAVARVAEKIHQRMAEPIVIGNHSLSSSFSIGVALYPDDGEDFDSLLQKADTAMYHAKEAGRNGHRFFTEQMNQKVVEHLTMETQLRHALENNEFVLHYQPQLDLHEGGIIGVEALIRWNNPEQGLVAPSRFIPVAEDSGLIVPIGAWVLNEACRQARAWQDAGLAPFVVAVNLSAVQFKRMDLVTTVINALVLSDLDSQWLELELTESILIQDAEATLDSVRRLKALGVKLSVDDFGTGYSSLTYLKRFAVDKLKIDQSFVRDLVSDPDDAAIVRAIIQMAHSLKLKTIAEGVESEELANLLRLFHCDEIQGFWFARPLPADQLEAFVRSRLAS